MADDLSKLNFADDLEEARQAEDARRWCIDHRGELELWVTVSPRGFDGDRFVARLFWSHYPAEPSVKFVDPATGRLDMQSAWPQARGFRPTSFDICATWTAEGFGLHPEWAKSQYHWDNSGNVLLKTLRTLQDELDQTYQGRFRE